MPFDPRSHTIKLAGRKDRNGVAGPPIDYLPVKQRVRWLREEHPDAAIDSHIIEITPDQAIFQASVSVPGGGSATATGSERKVAFADYIEKAESVALGRALAILGYGIDFADEFEESKEAADPRDYEVNQGNAVQQTTASKRYQTRPDDPNPKPPAAAPRPVPEPRAATGENGLASEAQVKAIYAVGLKHMSKAELVAYCEDQFDGKQPEYLLKSEAGELIKALQAGFPS